MKYVLDANAFAPERAHPYDAGLDIRSPSDFVIPARSSATVDTGVHVELPTCSAGFLKSKSGLNVKHGITSEGVIDYGYTGSIVVKLYNHSGEPYHVRRGDKITQLVVVPILVPFIEETGTLSDSARGTNGFGSTGR